MKKILILFFLFPLGKTWAQDIKIFNPNKPLPHAYDTNWLSKPQKENLQALETFKESMFAHKIESAPDTSVRYSMLYKGNCVTSWPQRLRTNQPFYEGERTYGCRIDTVQHKTFSLMMLHKIHQHATIEVYGNRYLWIREYPVTWDGSATSFARYTEYFLESVE